MSRVLHRLHFPLFSHVQKSNVWKWNGQSSNRWMKLDMVKMELPRDTVLKAEFVMELRGEVSVTNLSCVISI